MKKNVCILLLVLIFLNSCSKQEITDIKTEIKPKYVKTQIVEEKAFTEDIKLAGKVVSSQETTISPLSAGVIKNVNVNVGDKVRAGDILAIIDTQSNLTNISLNNAENTYNNTVTIYNTTKEALEKGLDTAKLQLENAKISRENVYNSTEKQLELVKSQLETVLKQKDNTSKTANSSVSLAEEGVKQAELSLENFNKNYNETLKTFESKKKSLIDNIKISIDSSLITINNSLTLVDNILGITNLNKNLNDSYETYLSAKNTQFKVDAENLFLEINSKLEYLKAQKIDNFTQEELLRHYSDLYNLTEKSSILFEKMNGVLDNSITSSNLNELILTGFKTSVKTYEGQVLGLKGNITSLTNALNDLENTINSTKTSLDTQKLTIEQSIEIAKATLNNTISATNTSIDGISSTENTTKIQLESTITSIKASREASDNAVKIAENQYSSAKSSYSSQLAGVKSQLDGVKGQKSSLNQQISNAYIKAPFDGIITTKNIEVGSSVSQAMPVFGIANSIKKIIKLDITGENIKYLSIGKEVKIEKNTKSSTGNISVLANSSNDITKMYKVEISINDKDFNNYLVLGDYVDVYIKKEVLNEKLIVIPFSSIIVGNNDTYFVYVVSKENLISEKKVSIGSSNSKEVVIKDGLKVGEKIVIEGALNISTGDKVEEM